MARSQRQIDNNRQRKHQARLTGKSCAGSSLRKRHFDKIILETVKYLQMKEIPFASDPAQSRVVGLQRGMIRGLVWGYCNLYGNPYDGHLTKEITSMEKQVTR